MHFRHLLITGLIVGAAFFLPDNVLAEKNGSTGPMNAPGTAQGVDPSVEMDHSTGNPAAPDKGKPADVPAPAMNKQEGALQQPAIDSANTPAAGSQMPVEAPQKPVVTPEKPVAASQQSAATQGKSDIVSQQSHAAPGKSNVALQKAAATQGKSDVASQKAAAAQGKSDVALQKAAAASRNLPNQAKGKVQPYLNKSEKSLQARASEKLISAQEKKNGIDTLFKEERISAYKSLHIAEKDGKTGFPLLWSAPQGEDTPITAVFSEKNAVQPMQLPYQKGDIPAGKEEIPKASQIPNPTQRTSNHGGPSNDRMNPGISGISFPDKWLAWNSYYEIQLVQSYQSRQIRLNNQWVNAPPSPPPQEAPLLETVTRS